MKQPGKKPFMRLLVMAALMTASQSMHAQNNDKKRFLDPVFNQLKQDTGIIYSKERNYAGNLQSLAMDVYRPQGDTMYKRPAIVFMHGGAFMMGSRKDDYAVAFCRQFAQRGYLTVSLSYRLGVKDYSPQAFGDAIYRATQDARAAVRFLRAHAAQYDIDPNQIYLGGGSAGAIAALHAAYWTQEEVPAYLDTRLMGNLDATGDYKQYPTEVSGVVNCWGALIDTSYMRNKSVPVVSIHGIDDPVVPYKYNGMGKFGLYGSYYIHQEAEKLGTPSTLQAFPDTGHGLRRSDTQKWNAALDTISRFLYSLVKDKYTFLDEGEARQVA